jgi:RNA polymerase II elongation factor ELL
LCFEVFKYQHCVLQCSGTCRLIVTKTLRFDGKSRVLDVSPVKYRQEFYQSSPQNENEWRFSGTVDHVLALQKAQEVTGRVEETLQKLKSSMASLEQEQEARK